MGKITNINILAAKKSRETLAQHEIFKCEVTGDSNPQFLTVAHRFGRIYYRHAPELLWDINHIIYIRQDIHTGIEGNDEKTEKLFIKLRGKLPMASVNNKLKTVQKKGNKPGWMKPHKCKHCGIILSGLFCKSCNQLSI
jgi:hypothetical protein